jgi:hypothetical protein
MGSGKHLKNSIAKHGIENFKKEILFQFDNEAEMNAKEAELVTEEFCLKEDTYNLCPGGKGGWGYLYSNGLSVKQFENKEFAKVASLKANKVKENLWNTDTEWSHEYRKKLSIKAKKQIELNGVPFLGKTHSDEAKQKIGQASSINQKGTKNSQFGTTWIWHEKFGNKKIKKDVLEDYINDGWSKTYKPGYRVPINDEK